MSGGDDDVFDLFRVVVVVIYSAQTLTPGGI
jgi:hypothetical protein